MGPLGYFLMGWCLCQLKAPIYIYCIFYFAMIWGLFKWLFDD